MTFKELRNMLNRMDDEKLDQEVSVISYGMNDGTSTTDIEVGDWTTDELYIGAHFDEGRKDSYEKAMDVVCGECGNTDGAQCDECWVKRSWRVMNGKPDSPTPKRNPNVAETVSYECKDDPTFRKGVLVHQATVRWNSGKSFDEHAPERIGLRVGGKLYEYKAI